MEQILSLSQLLGARLSGLRLPPAFPAARPAEKKSAAWWETFWFEAAAGFPRRPARRKEIREPCHVALSSTSGKWLWAGKRIDNYCLRSLIRFLPASPPFRKSFLYGRLCVSECFDHVELTLAYIVGILACTTTWEVEVETSP